jgi:hypothetical protein
VAEMNYDGFAPQELYINVMFSIFSKILTAIKSFDASNSKRTSTDNAIIRRAKGLISQLSEKLKGDVSPDESFVSINKLCNLYFKAAKFRDEDSFSSYHAISDKMREEILGMFNC